MSIKTKISQIMKSVNYKLLLKNVKPQIIGYKDVKGEYIFQTCVSNVSHVGDRENLILGKKVRIGHFNYVDTHEKVTIESGSQISNYVSILTHSTHHNIRFSGSELETNSDILLVSKEVFIGKCCYIGPHTVIMPGTKLGKGCIVSAYSLVSGTFPDFSIIKGQPAKVIGSTRDIDLPFLENHPEYKEYYYDKDNI